MNMKSDSTTQFQFLEAYLLVNRIRPNPAYVIAHNATLAIGGLARYNLTSVELKTFPYSADPKSLFGDNAFLGQFPERLLLIMIKNKDFLCCLGTNPYY